MSIFSFINMSGGPVEVFKKYTTGSHGIWETLRQWVTLVPNRSSGNPYVPLYRVPAPTSEPHKYKDSAARTIPASDIVLNDFHARDNRRHHPQVSTFDQQKVAALLKLGNATSSRLAKGDEGVKQLAAVSQVSLVETLTQSNKDIIFGEVLDKDGGPIVAPAVDGGKFRMTIQPQEEHGMYDESYPVRMFK